MSDQTSKLQSPNELDEEILISTDVDGIKSSESENQSDGDIGTNQTSTSFSFDTYDLLSSICEDNKKYYEHDSSETGRRFLIAIQKIIDHLPTVRDYHKQFNTFLHEYDFDENTPGNGFRSYIKAVEVCINRNVKIGQYISKKRGDLLFKKTTYMKEIESCSELFVSLCKGLKQLLIIKEECEPGSLFIPGEHTAIGLLNRAEGISLLPFYGRCIGLHYCKTIRPVVKMFATCAAGFSELYYNRNKNRFKKATTSMYTGSKYYLNPERRAQRLIQLSQNAGNDFLKAMASAIEGKKIYALSKMMFTKVKVNRLITIPPELLEIEHVHSPNEMVNIPVPSSYFGVGSVTARLLSNVRRDGMIGEPKSPQNHAPSNGLIFHCHGGGFIATTSKSHEVYLREWAARLQVPILSIDYSLSPEAPYPRALEEVFYAYCWAIKNAHLLGTTAEKIVVAGDSAGATLSVALTLKCIEQQVRRPDGVLSVYGPMNMDYIPSPARGLCIMDVVLPIENLMSCLKAYVQFDKEKMPKSDEKQLTKVCVDKPSIVTIESHDIEEVNGEQTDLSISIDDTSSSQYVESVSSLNGNFEMKTNSIAKESTSKESTSRESLSNTQEINHADIITHDKSSRISVEINSPPVSLIEPNDKFDIMNLDLNPTETSERRTSALSTQSQTNPTESSKRAKKNRINVMPKRNRIEYWNVHVPKDPFLSPFLASDEMLKQFPPTKIVAGDMDGLLDDSVEMAKRLQRVGVSVQLDILPGLCHAFLSFIKMSKEAYDGNRVCISRLAELLGLTEDCKTATQT